MNKIRRVNIPLPPGEIQEWVKNAARHFGMTQEQFLMICVQDAWQKLYNKTFTWKDFTLVERKNLEKLESQVARCTCNKGGIPR